MRTRLFSIFFSAVFCVALAASGNTSHAQVNKADDGVKIHSIEAIKGFVSAYSTSRSDLYGNSITYSKNPTTTKPYTEEGLLSSESAREAISLVNTVRYIAGLDYDVIWDNEYAQLAQCAALVNYANGSLSHYPKKPEGMSNSIYKKGETGASRSNIAYGYSSMWSVIVDGWMSDEDSTNIKRVGHRRWILNPKLKKTGVGYIADSNYSAMYVVDYSNENASQTHVAWPAANMPLEFFASDCPWSLSFGEEISPSAKVTLVNEKTNKTWTFSKDYSDGDFFINNDNRGLSGCVIFRPNDIGDYSHGDVFSVSITDTGLSDYSYKVNFYDLDRVEGIEDDFSIKNKKGGVPMLRLLDPASGEHVYTSDWEEINQLVAQGLRYEGYAWSAPKKSSTPVFRLRSDITGEHHYTTDANERDTLAGQGWTDEGIGWYSDDDKGRPLYRLNNPAVSYGSHHYTLDQNEKDMLIKAKWEDEGIGWYGLR